VRGERGARAEVVTEVDGAAGDGVGELAGGGVCVVEHRGEGGAQGRDAPLHLPSHGGGGDGGRGSPETAKEGRRGFLSFSKLSRGGRGLNCCFVS
jgi:hypothetical protein